MPRLTVDRAAKYQSAGGPFPLTSLLASSFSCTLRIGASLSKRAGMGQYESLLGSRAKPSRRFFLRVMLNYAGEYGEYCDARMHDSR